MKCRSISVFATVAVLAAAAAFAGQASRPAGKVFAHFTTSEGAFTIELFEKEAPKTVANFVGLAEGTKEWTDPKTGEKVKKPYYDGLTFHRVIAGFMIQGGDPLGVGTGGPGYSIPDEFNKVKLDKAGILAMANKGTPNSGSAQFFITLAATPWLDGKHTVFGEVTKGLDVIEKIGGTKTTKPGDKPVKPIIVQSVKIERK
jgi:peptidyl-prolyl cis-trans isomerase A (cyclophilin A)